MHFVGLCFLLLIKFYEFITYIPRLLKKSRQLEQVIEELKACLDQFNFPVSKTRGADHSVNLEHCLLLTR